MRHQSLAAMHEEFGRPAFRPPAPRVLGTGVLRAFTGDAGHMRVHGPDGPLTEDDAPGLGPWLRTANQHFEMTSIAGPADDEVDDLRKKHGYRPEKTEESGRSRLAWEAAYRDMLLSPTPSALPSSTSVSLSASSSTNTTNCSPA